jgi:phage terminase small subunit
MTDQTIPLSPNPQPHAEEAALAAVSMQEPHAEPSPTLRDAPIGAPQGEVAALSPRPLSMRHGRFVLEYLRDGNATQAYIRAGYSPRGAQPSASKLLRDPRIAAAVAAGRQRLVDALEVSVERLAQEYAKIAFANVADYVSTDAEGGLRVDLDKASEAQRAGILELRISNHRNPEQRVVTLKLGKLQALAALTKNVQLLGKKSAQALTAEERRYYEERHAADQLEVKSSDERYWEIQSDLAKTEEALAIAESRLAAASRHVDEDCDLFPDYGEEMENHSNSYATAESEAPRPPIVLTGLGPPDPPRQRRKSPSPTQVQPEPHVAGAGNGRIFWNTARQPPAGPTWNDIVRNSRFPGQ